MFRFIKKIVYWINSFGGSLDSDSHITKVSDCIKCVSLKINHGKLDQHLLI